MHPQTAGIDWLLDELIFEAQPAGIAIAMFTRRNGTEQALGFRWIQQGQATTYFGKNSEWILLPHDFAVCAARKIIEKRAAGMPDIYEAGFRKMVKMLTDQEDIIAAIGY
jgi:hypothetical protein